MSKRGIASDAAPLLASILLVTSASDPLSYHTSLCNSLSSCTPFFSFCPCSHADHSLPHGLVVSGLSALSRSTLSQSSTILSYMSCIIGHLLSPPSPPSPPLAPPLPPPSRPQPRHQQYALCGRSSVYSITQWVLSSAALAVYDCAPVSYAIDILGYMRVHGMSLWRVTYGINSARRHQWKFSVSFLPFVVGESSP